LTLAIHGFDKLGAQSIAERNPFEAELGKSDAASEFTIYPNPTARIVYMNQLTDVALYDANGKRVLVQRNVNEINVSGLTPGTYFLQNAAGKTVQLSIQ
jgi:hypothetical protein